MKVIKTIWWWFIAATCIFDIFAMLVALKVIFLAQVFPLFAASLVVKMIGLTALASKSRR